MQEVESKRKMTPGDGAHLFFTIIFLVASYKVLTNEQTATCNVNLYLVAQMIFYSQLVWMTYLLITLVPRCVNRGLKIFFNIIDLLYGLFHLIIFIYACTQYYSPKNNCSTGSPVLNFFTNLYIHVMIVILIVVKLASTIWICKRIFKPKESAGFVQSEL